MASEALWGALPLVNTARDAAARLCEAKRAWRPSISMLFSTRRSSAPPGCSPTAFIAGGAAEP
eukprot:5979532-Prymnesium_polylepis.1